jgi:Glycosyl transferases group 1
VTPLRILHVGNGNEKHRGQRFYDVGRKLQHGLIRAGHNALFFSDRDTARTSGVCGTKYRGAERCNAKLLEVARHFKPEMLLLGHADIITNETLAQLRINHPALRIAQFNVDPLFRPENDAAIRARLPYVDTSFITTGGEVLRRYDTAQHRAFYIPNPIDPALETHRMHAHTSTPYDVFYAVRATTTTGSQEGNDRLTIPRYLRDSMPDLRCHFHGFDGVPELFGAAFYEAIGQCWAGLNLSHKCTTKGERIEATPQEKHLYSSDRLSQYLGCGLLTFSERGFGQERLFSEEEMVFFASKEELAEKLDYYRTHPELRQRIAENGWRKAHSQLNTTLVAHYIVEEAMQWPHSSAYYWVNL